MKVWIIGNAEKQDAYYKAEKKLKDAGHIVINPVRIIHALPVGINNSDFTTIAFEFIRICDAVYLINGYQKDLIANMQFAHAKRNEKTFLK